MARSAGFSSFSSHAIAVKYTPNAGKDGKMGISPRYEQIRLACKCGGDKDVKSGYINVFS
ncbi:hypothetical protein BRAS3809_3090023 [Bradyrhizobium sp. STM 3809]|nr:hypothetical protein BRAS3809_3090023 [Bradyrhizobium sp. STM 3809]